MTRQVELIVSEKNKKVRLDEYLVLKQLVNSRHQAADLIKRKQVKLNGRFIDKPALRLDLNIRQRIQLQIKESYVSRAGYKLQAAAKTLDLNFKNKIVLDAGANQGGFTDFALQRGASWVVAVDVGRQKLDPSLSIAKNVLAFNQVDIRDFIWPPQLELPDLIVVDLSFISLTKVLNHLLKFCHMKTKVLILAKPQFEAEGYDLQKGVIKNQIQRRDILKRLEGWLKDQAWLVEAKTDSQIAGLKGNLERFYLLKPTKLKNSLKR